MAVRLIVQAQAGALDVLAAATAIARDMPGCLHAEDFRSVEAADRMLHLELWDTPAAWDAAWIARRDTLAPIPGQVELYRQASFAPTGPAWVAAGSPETIRWPAPTGAIRILILVAADPATPVDIFVRNSVETRAEPGCGAFEYYRGVDYPENLALIESWSSPPIYDDHWRRRIAQDAPAPPPPPARRYGETSFEWYSECPYALTDGVWAPADAALRMDTVVW